MFEEPPYRFGGIEIGTGVAENIFWSDKLTAAMENQHQRRQHARLVRPRYMKSTGAFTIIYRNGPLRVWMAFALAILTDKHIKHTLDKRAKRRMA